MKWDTVIEEMFSADLGHQLLFGKKVNALNGESYRTALVLEPLYCYHRMREQAYDSSITLFGANHPQNAHVDWNTYPNFQHWLERSLDTRRDAQIDFENGTLLEMFHTILRPPYDLLSEHRTYLSTALPEDLSAQVYATPGKPTLLPIQETLHNGILWHLKKNKWIFFSS